MTRKAAVATAVIVYASATLILAQERYLWPHLRGLLQAHGLVVAAYVGALAVNVFALAYVTIRTLTLRRAGEKLLHVEREIAEGHSPLSRSAEWAHEPDLTGPEAD